MKKFLALCVLYVCTTSDVFAQPPPPPPEKVPLPPPAKVPEEVSEEEKKPIIADYEATMKHFKELTAGYASEETYKEVIFKTKDGKEKPFKELTDFEKHAFYLLQAQNISRHLQFLEQAWTEEFEKLSKEPEPKKEVGAKESEQIATAKDVKKYLGELLKMRKSHAAHYEQFTYKVFEKFKDDIPEESRKAYIKRMKEWHDTYKLIDRPKS